MTESLPWRGVSGDRRPARADLGALPLVHGGRLRKRWRYVGVYGERLMLCAGVVQVGLAGQAFWAVWDRERRVLHERTRLWRGTAYVRLPHTGVHVRDGGVAVALGFAADPHAPTPVETVSPVDGGAAWMWTRKSGGVRLRGTVALPGGERVEMDARGIIDESAGYHPRRTEWSWSAGVGALADGRGVAWNLVSGIHDGPDASERTVWVDGVPAQLPPAAFAPDLSGVSCGGDGVRLVFAQEAVRSRSESFGLIRSDYTQPFGTFSGTLGGGLELGDAYGVMERHSALW